MGNKPPAYSPLTNRLESRTLYLRELIALYREHVLAGRTLEAAELAKEARGYLRFSDPALRMPSHSDSIRLLEDVLCGGMLRNHRVCKVEGHLVAQSTRKA